MSREDLLNIDNFDRIPIIQAIKNPENIDLRHALKNFLYYWNDPYCPVYKDWWCPYMVDHSLPHIQNLFVFANRICHFSEEIKAKLNDAEFFSSNDYLIR